MPFALIAVSYLIGSIPFSFLIVKFLLHDDIRERGSGNVGATNVLRTSGKAAGFLALLLDGSKGACAVLLARWMVSLPQWPFAGPSLGSQSIVEQLAYPSFWVGLAALLAVLGHIFPVWLRFDGGKGVATAAGVYLALHPFAFLIALVIVLIVVAISRYVSLGSIVAAAAMPLILRFIVGDTFWTIAFSIVISLIIIVKHHENISRIASGTERRLGGAKDES